MSYPAPSHQEIAAYQQQHYMLQPQQHYMLQQHRMLQPQQALDAYIHAAAQEQKGQQHQMAAAATVGSAPAPLPLAEIRMAWGAGAPEIDPGDASDASQGASDEDLNSDDEDDSGRSGFVEFGTR
jgi:hypothetical protein